ncbi:MAG: c-type cytochrome, partial [Alphaproteobacteria bacterium]
MMGNPKRIVFFALFASFIFYSGYIYSSGTATHSAAPPSLEAQAGQRLFQKKNCIACHQFYGLGGYMGPDLTNVISEDGKGPEY